ncbi:hypothetical protein VP395_00300 [Mariniflexile soesokkakense]|uniref:Tellurite resistance protein TerB n=1 Tax=Mariniflexile soesokkakense TaxID=1343160 RepID=A0ABV0A5J8_9FLAO
MFKNLNLKFYQNIGKLFYALAGADKVVHPNEFNTFKEFVSREWLSVDDTEDEYKTDAAYQMEIVFDWLASKKLNANTCFKEFIAYKNEHKYFFTSDMNTLILKTAVLITSAFSGQNKSEVIMLSKLSIELSK